MTLPSSPLSRWRENLSEGSVRNPADGSVFPSPAIAISVMDTFDAAAIQALTPAASRLLLVTDDACYKALGTRVHRALEENRHVTLQRFETPPSPTLALAEMLVFKAQHADMLVAVGSGTVNDLTKYAASQAGKPYTVFPTALSMNGYLSANASLLADGTKQSFPAQPPIAALLDRGVLRHAPERLTRAGFADVYCFATARCDAMLTHLLWGTPYPALPFALLEPLIISLETADNLPFEILAETVLCSGLGMTLAGGSAPASQGEHMIAHRMEMMGEAGTALHGEAIAVTTLTMARLQERLLNGPAPVIPTGAKGGYGDKDWTPERIAHANRILPEIWPLLKPYTPDAARMERVLASIGAPLTPEALEWNGEAYRQAVQTAHRYRDRFTFLDLDFSV